MDVFEAAYRVAHDFPGGAVELAKQIGENPGTFLNRVNPAQEEHKLWLAIAVRMQKASGDHRILYAMAATLGEVCFKVPDLKHVPDAALVELLCKIGKEGGDFYAATNEGLADRSFSRADFERIQTEGLEFIAAIAEAVARIEGLIDE